MIKSLSIPSITQVDGLLLAMTIIPKVNVPEARDHNEACENIFFSSETSSLTSRQFPCSFIIPCKICYSL